MKNKKLLILKRLITPKIIVYKFINLKQLANFDVMKCIKLLFSIIGIKTNIGFYSFFPTIIVYIITLFIFYLKELKRIMNQTDEIIAIKKLIFYPRNKELGPKKKKNKLSFFYNFVDKKKINFEFYKEKDSNKKENIENDDNIEIISNKKNKNETSKDSYLKSKLPKKRKNYKA